MCLLDPLDLTHYIWCLGIDTDPIPEGDVLLEAPIAEEYGWGPIDPKIAPEDGEPVLGV